MIRFVVDANSQVLSVSDEAVELFGLTLEEFRALPPGALSPEADVEAMEGLEDEWRKSGSGPMVGAGTVRLPTGRSLRMRYLVSPLDDGTFEIILDRIDEPVSTPPRAYTVGTALSAWRAADRRLQRLNPTDAEWAAVMAEVDHFRNEYRRLVASATAKEPQADWQR